MTGGPAGFAVWLTCDAGVAISCARELEKVAKLSPSGAWHRVDRRAQHPVATCNLRTDAEVIAAALVKVAPALITTQVSSPPYPKPA